MEGNLKLMGVRWLMVLMVIGGCSGFEFIQLNRRLEKGGLHRVMANQISFKVDNQTEVDVCKLVFAERVNQGSYIYLEEVLKLTNFTYYPKKAIDIERPASASQNHSVWWSVPLSVLMEGNEWVTNVTKLKTVKKGDTDVMSLVKDEEKD